MVAEERITTKFAGLVMAADSEEEASFLATQQVDEARHMQFYARVQDEVIAEPEAIADHVARSRERLGDSFAVIFDQALVTAHDRLVANPRDAAAKVDFVTTYHLIIESTLGLTAFEFITRYLSEQRRPAGLRRGLHAHPPRRAAPHRLRRLVPARGGGRDPALADRVRATLRELLPAAAARAGPARPRRRTDFEALGAIERRDPRVRAERPDTPAEDRRRAARHALSPRESSAETSMEPSNVQIVFASRDAFTRRDDDAVRELHSDDVVFDWSRSHGPYRGVYRGIDEVLGFVDGFMDTVVETRWLTLDARELGNGTVVARIIVAGRGADSGIEVRAEGGGVFALRDGKVASVTLYQSLAEALAATEG